jgi:DNA-binding transcriptional LysR family regulator
MAHDDGQPTAAGGGHRKLAGMLGRLVDSIDTIRLSEHLDLNADISWSALVAFVAVDEFGHYGKAAKFLGKQQQGLRQHVKNLEEALHSQLIGTGPDGEYQAVGLIGRELRERARLMVYQYGAIGRLTDQAVRIQYLPQHCFFMAPVEARLDGVVELRSTTLGEEVWSQPRFHDDVIVPLAAGMIDFAVGIPPAEDAASAELLNCHYLYSYCQEAMVPVSDPRERAELAELVAEARLIVPPVHVRPRIQLEAEVVMDVPDDPGPAVRVKRESYATKVLIQYGMKGLGTVVLPSSIAFPFYHGNAYGGPETADFKWIPVCTSSGQYLHQDVHALTRRVRDRYSDQVNMILELVRQEAADLGLDKDRSGQAMHP